MRSFFLAKRPANPGVCSPSSNEGLELAGAQTCRRRAEALRGSPAAAQNQAGCGLAAGAGAHGLLDQLDQPRAVDQLDRMIGDELLGRERERAAW